MIFCFIFKFLEIKEKFKNELLGDNLVWWWGRAIYSEKSKPGKMHRNCKPYSSTYLLENEVEISRNTNLIPLT